MFSSTISPTKNTNSSDAQRFRALVECSSDAVFVTDFDSAQFVEVNENSCKLFGYSAKEFIGKTGRELHPESAQVLVDEISKELVLNGSVWRPSIRLKRKDGTEFSGELRSHCYHTEDRTLYISFVRDLSAQDSRESELQEAYRHLRETQDQLIHTARLAAVGQLATGIAHEVNNPTAYVFSNLEALLNNVTQLTEYDSQPQPDKLDAFVSDSKENLKDCLEGLGRIAAIVRGLKAFARIDRKDISLVNINDVVHSAINLLRPQTRHIAKVELALNSTRMIAADRGKLVQVMVNLIMNSAQAIAEAAGTSITVTTYDIELGIIISVEDDGPGVPVHVANRLFEPFFTTKIKDGTGLGLSLCTDILGQHNATIRLDENPEKGARFELFFPKETLLVAKTNEENQESSKQLRALKILVIDDETALVRAYRRALGQQHEVIAAYNGQEALAILTKDQSFDVILCDLMMPIKDGIDLYNDVLTFEPSLSGRFIFCTGGSSSSKTIDFIERNQLTLLEKPFGQQKLQKAIATMLDKISLSEASI